LIKKGSLNAGKYLLLGFPPPILSKIPVFIMERKKEMDDEKKAVICGVAGLVTILIATLFGAFSPGEPRCCTPSLMESLTESIIPSVIVIIGLCFVIMAITYEFRGNGENDNGSNTK